MFFGTDAPLIAPDRDVAILEIVVIDPAGHRNLQKQRRALAGEAVLSARRHGKAIAFAQDLGRPADIHFDFATNDEKRLMLLLVAMQGARLPIKDE